MKDDGPSSDPIQLRFLEDFEHIVKFVKFAEV